MYNNNRRRKIRIIDVTNHRNGVNFECNYCGYVCHGMTGAKLHLKYTHGLDEKNTIKTKQFCIRCSSVFQGPVSEHMVRHREEI